MTSLQQGMNMTTTAPPLPKSLPSSFLPKSLPNGEPLLREKKRAERKARELIYKQNKTNEKKVDWNQSYLCESKLKIVEGEIDILIEKMVKDEMTEEELRREKKRAQRKAKKLRHKKNTQQKADKREKVSSPKGLEDIKEMLQDTYTPEQMMRSRQSREEYQRQRAQTDEGFTTKYVKPKYFKRGLSKFNNVLGMPKKVKVHPLGLNNYCHDNSKKAADFLGAKCRMGYNITACPCGNMMGLEIHSVVEVDKQFYDFTRDFGGEITKWFAPFREDILYRDFEQLHQRYFDNIQVGERFCKCNCNWSSHGGFEVKELEEAVKMEHGIQRETGEEEEFMNMIMNLMGANCQVVCM